MESPLDSAFERIAVSAMAPAPPPLERLQCDVLAAATLAALVGNGETRFTGTDNGGFLFQRGEEAFYELGRRVEQVATDSYHRESQLNRFLFHRIECGRVGNDGDVVYALEKFRVFWCFVDRIIRKVVLLEYCTRIVYRRLVHIGRAGGNFFKMVARHIAEDESDDGRWMQHFCKPATFYIGNVFTYRVHLFYRRARLE